MLRKFATFPAYAVFAVPIWDQEILLQANRINSLHDNQLADMDGQLDADGMWQLDADGMWRFYRGGVQDCSYGEIADEEVLYLPDPTIPEYDTIACGSEFDTAEFVESEQNCINEAQYRLDLDNNWRLYCGEKLVCGSSVVPLGSNPGGVSHYGLALSGFELSGYGGALSLLSIQCVYDEASHQWVAIEDTSSETTDDAHGVENTSPGSQNKINTEAIRAINKIRRKRIKEMQKNRIRLEGEIKALTVAIDKMKKNSPKQKKSIRERKELMEELDALERIFLAGLIKDLTAAIERNSTPEAQQRKEALVLSRKKAQELLDALGARKSL